MIIRPERTADVEAISEITKAAFLHHPFSHQTEAFIVLELRAAGALTLSLVAEIDGAVVGHVCFSPVAIADGSADWFALGPLSVAPARQSRGIGSALVRQGLELLKARGAQGCILVGPPAYYRRFGFAHHDELTMHGVPPEVTLALRFGERMAKGAITHHAAFGATGK